MAIRTDIFSIDWSLSPRIINIDIGFTEASTQDLYDTCKHLEGQTDAMDEDQICDAGGREPLGGGVTVGITVSLFNARYKFADRAGPTWIICNMTGGNVVAFTDKTRTTSLYPREPSTYVSADRTASSAATTQEQKAIQHASYNGGIMLDEMNSTGKAVTGQVFPAGTELTPCLFQEDAHAIALAEGFSKIFVRGDLTLDNASLDFLGFKFVGQSQIKTLITINTVADVFNCEFEDCTVTGVLDGSSKMQQCLLTALDFIDGYIFECSLGVGEIKLGTLVQADIFNCFSGIAGGDMPTIDMNATGIIAMRGYKGSAYFKNYSGSSEHTIGLSEGNIILESTSITSGTFHVRGQGTLRDEFGNDIPDGTWNGGVTIVKDLLGAKRILDLLEGDVVPTPSEFKILNRITKAVLLRKDAAEVSGLTQLTE